MQGAPVLHIPEVDVSKIFHSCENLKVFIIEFKDSLQVQRETAALGWGKEVGSHSKVSMLFK